MGPPLFRYFCSRFDKNIADDLVQETFVRVFKKLKQNKFEQERGSLRQYTFGIALYISREARRDLKNKFCEAELREEIMSKNSNVNFELENLKRAFSYLTDDERDILELQIDSWLTISEISDLLKMPIGTIKSHIHRAKIKLKNALSKGEKDE